MPRRLPLVDQVTLDLARKVKSMRSVDHMLPSERELALQIGVSRPVLREAIRNLENQGLVEVRHGVGVMAVNKPHRPITGSFERVVSSGPAGLVELIEARHIIEPGVARLAAIRANAPGVARLRALHEQLVGTTDLAAAVELDLAFHRMLADIAGNPALGAVLDALADMGRKSRSVTLKAFGISRAVEHHGRILDAIAESNPDAAFAAMDFHLQQDVVRQSSPNAHIASESPSKPKLKPR